MSTPDEPQRPVEPAPAEPGAFEPEPLPAAAAPPPPLPVPDPGQAPPPPAYAQPGYQQPGYAQPYSAPAPTASKPKTWMNITSLITSILGMGLIGVIFGHLGVNAANKGQADLKGLGIAGLVLGYISIVAGIILTIVIVAAIGDCASDPACVDWWSNLETTT